MTGNPNNGEKNESATDGLQAIGPAALRLLLERTPVVVWAVDRDLRLTASDGAGLVALGLRPGEGVGCSLYEHFGKNGTADAGFPPINVHLGALRGEASDFEHEWRGRLMAVRVAPLHGAGGAIEGALGLAFDVTDQREAERVARAREGELREARKADLALRALRPRLGEVEEQIAGLQALGDRLAGAAGGPVSLREIDQLRRGSARALDAVRALSDASPDVDVEAKNDNRYDTDRGGGETILLVDDEPQVRGFVRRALEDQGYRVLEAGTVEEALSIGAGFEGRIHLLLTDVVLPGQNGPHLAARLAPVRPEMRILYMTGYADDAIVDRGVLSAGQSLLVKPFTSLGLAHGVKKALRS